MKKQKNLSKLYVIFGAIIALATFSVPAYAEESSGSSSGSSQSVRVESESNSSGDSQAETESEHTTTSDSSSHSSKSQSKASSSGQEKKEAQRMKVCAKHQAVANKITARIADRGQRQLDLFTTIATRVEAFYTKSGATVANYDELVNAVNTEKAKAQAAVDTIKATTVTLKCDGTDAKGVGAAFKASLKSEIQALKDYRTAVKNLTVAVKSAQNPTNSTEPTNTEGSQQ